MNDFILTEQVGKIYQRPALTVIPPGHQMIGFHIGKATVALTPEATDYFANMEEITMWTRSSAQIIVRDFESNQIRLVLSSDYVLRGAEYPVGIVYAVDLFGMAQYYAIAETDHDQLLEVLAFITRIFPWAKTR